MSPEPCENKIASIMDLKLHNESNAGNNTGDVFGTRDLFNISYSREL